MTRTLIAGVLLLCTAAPALAQFGLDKALETGKKLKDLQISEEQEREIGARVSDAIRQRYGVVQDAAVHRYVGLVGQALAASSPRPKLGWQFIVLDTDGVNAFAAPGGFVHITRGALALIRNEAELGGVLGHEIEHVTEKHTINAIKKKNAKDLGLEYGPGGGWTKEMVTRLAGAATEMVLAGFGRDEELESDQKGIVLANAVGYTPGALGAFLTRLSERNTGATDRRGLFASHPEMKERLDRLGKQIAREKLAGSAVLADRYASSIAFESKPQAEIAQVENGAAGLAGGKGASQKGGETTTGESEPPKKRGFGLGSLVRPGGEEKKSAQVTASGGARGVDPERNAKGGGNPAIVKVTITAADVTAFKKAGKLL